MNYKVLIAALRLTGCASRQDILHETPMLDSIHFGSYEGAAICTFRDLQNTTTWPPYNYHYIPIPTQGYTEIQVTASDAFTGTIYASIIKFEHQPNDQYRVIVKAGFKADGLDAIQSVKRCVGFE